MQVIWLKSDYVSPPDTGGKIRSYNLMRRLHQRCHVTYLCLKNIETPDSEGEFLDCAAEINSVYRPEEKKQGVRFLLRLLRRMFSPIPYVAQKYKSKEILRFQKDILNPSEGSKTEERSTVLLCDFLDMAENVDWQSSAPKILFEHNVESQLWHQYYEITDHPIEKAYFKFEHMRMTAYERRICNRFDLVLVVSEADKRLLKEELGVRCPIEVLPTGVDTDFFSPRYESPKKRDKILFLGSLDWLPNIDAIRWFYEKIYPSIRESRPNVSWDIVGRRPGDDLFELVGSDSTIRIFADVPDVRPFMEASEVFVVPLRIGGGTRIKIYEAMAMELPVVSTLLGAQGLDVEPGEDIEIADSAQEFAQRILHLLENSPSRKELAKSGRRLVEDRCSWDRVAENLHDYCQELVSDSVLPGV
jgi:glycosyltransferase involved in cell wall biosynthesis